jgi:GNAT superfamily N-acetyltransferase
MPTEGSERRYGPDFSEDVALADGSKAVIRTVRPEDRELLRRGFDALSPESRYLRFFSTKLRLSEKELEYLTNVDGENHFAIGASRFDEVGREEGLGIGRFIRDAEHPEVAEPALAVIDHAQGLGLGTLLLGHLTAAARERGIEVFQCELLAHNTTMARLLEEISPELSLKDIGSGIIEATVPLPHAEADGAPTRDRETAVHSLLSYAARRAGTVKLGRRLLAYLGYDSES